jgi:hypothetical protein
MSGRSGHLANPSPADLEARLLRPAEPGRFDPAELEGLAEPVRHHLAQAVAPGTALSTSARLSMRGQIKVGRWLPFRARQVLNPHQGFVWAARAAGLIAGVDRYADGAGLTDWKLAGLVTVAHGEGPDVTRSAAARAGAEGIWLPTALLPRFGVRWAAQAADRITAAFAVGDTPLELELRLDAAGRIMSLSFDRWGDPGDGGGYAWHPFGGEITGYASFAGLSIPSAGRLGWFWGTDRWTQGEFFRYAITGLQPVGPAGDRDPGAGSR